MGQSLPSDPELLRSIESLEIIASDQVGGDIAYTVKGNLILDLNSLDDGADSAAQVAAIRQVARDYLAPLALKLILENPGLRHHHADLNLLNRSVRIPRALRAVDPAIDALLARIAIRLDPALAAGHDARPTRPH